MAKKPTLKPGDRVHFARHWLRSTGQYTGIVPFACGTVFAIDVQAPYMTDVDWDNPDDELSPRVLACNLEKVRRVN